MPEAYTKASLEGLHVAKVMRTSKVLSKGGDTRSTTRAA